MIENAIEKSIESAEDIQEIPLGHRVAKVVIAAAAGVVASWAAEKAYDRAIRDRKFDAVEPENIYN